MYKEIFNFLKITISYYFRENVVDKIKDIVTTVTKNFIATLWEAIKIEVHKTAQEVVVCANEYLISEGAKIKKEELVEKVVAKIKLPLLLKPFRKLIKKKLNSKIDEMINSCMKKALDYTA